MAVQAFPLRIRQQGLRDLIREVAAQEKISQNDLLEQAAEHEVIARGALLSNDLAASAARLASLTADAYEQAIAASLISFADGEANPEPLRPRLISRQATHLTDPAGLVAETAFQRSSH